MQKYESYKTDNDEHVQIVYLARVPGKGELLRKRSS